MVNRGLNIRVMKFSVMYVETGSILVLCTELQLPCNYLMHLSTPEGIQIQ